jgi:outer membrane protein OmpA-like peptidoglycan-associated protein
MNQQRTPSLSAVGRATLAALAVGTAVVFASGCSTVPERNVMLEQAQADFRSAQNDTTARDLAAVQMREAGDALRAAEAAFQRNDEMAAVDHLSTLARTRVAIARETAARVAAERAVAEATAEREQVRLQARTAEADAARRSATSAQQDAQTAQRNAEDAQRQAVAAQQAAQSSQQQAAMSQQQMAEAEARTRALEAQLSEMDAKNTDRGMVITLGDVLFDTGRAALRSGGQRNVEKLAAFLKEYPQRNAMVEGFTDSVGGEGMNQALSERRADAVRSALVVQGIASDRIAMRGYGEAYPVASNDNSGGRAQNRRVEIVLSDDSGRIAPR